MKIVIATGIFEPESGGPATYAPALASRLVALGNDVTVITFSPAASVQDDQKYPFALVRVVRGSKVLSRFKFFNAVLKNARGCDLIYTLDWFAAGLPIAFAAFFLRVPYIVRIGGDYAWEQKYLESGDPPIPLTAFYERGIHRRFPYRIYYGIIRFVLKYARHVIFNSDRQRELYYRFFGLSQGRTSVIYNPRPVTQSPSVEAISSSKEFIYWGRLIVMKNVESLVRAFARAHIPGYSLTIIGEGSRRKAVESLVAELGLENRVTIEHGLPQKEAFERVRHARAFILPSWTDISPNQVFEALSLGLPALVTRENYLPIADQLPATIDPNSVEDIARGLEMLADDGQYADFARRFRAIAFEHDWNSVSAEHQALFESIIGARTGIRVLSIGADRSKRGILYPDSPAVIRQRAYGEHFDALDIVGFSRRSDARTPFAPSPKVHVYPTNSLSPLFYGLDTLRIMRTLPRADVITVQDPFETGLLGLLIARLRRLPLHVQVHTDFTAPTYARHSVVNRLRVIVAGFVVRRAARIRVVSQRVKSAIELRYKPRASTTVLPIFTDLKKFKNVHVDQALQERFAKFHTKLLVVSRLEPEKDVALAIKSFAQAAIPESCLIILGQGSERRALEKLAKESGVADRVCFEGDAATPPYYALADVVLVTSHYEGYGLVFIEALAAGKPVVSTNVGIAREVGAIVSSRESFAEAIAEWFKSGPRSMVLTAYPYADFDDYVRRYCDDIRACARKTC